MYQYTLHLSINKSTLLTVVTMMINTIVRLQLILGCSSSSASDADWETGGLSGSGRSQCPVVRHIYRANCTTVVLDWMELLCQTSTAMDCLQWISSSSPACHCSLCKLTKQSKKDIVYEHSYDEGAKGSRGGCDREARCRLRVSVRGPVMRASMK